MQRADETIMSLNTYRSRKMLFVLVILLAYNLPGSETLAVPKEDKTNVLENKDVDTVTKISLQNTEEDVSLAESNNILKLTKPDKVKKENYISTPNSTWFTLTTKVSINNDTSKEIITTADGILTIEPQSKYSVAKESSNLKENNTVVDSIYTTSYSILSVTTDGTEKQIDNEKSTKTTTTYSKASGSTRNLSPIDDVTLDEMEMITLEKTFSEVSNKPKMSTVSDNKNINDVKLETTNVGTDFINSSLNSSTYVDTTSESIYQNDNSLDNEKFKNITNNTKINDGNSLVAETQMQFAEESTNTQKNYLSTKSLTDNDTLSVRPIALESKPKNSTLYAVKASYKRPKKLEITQPKPFMRDPNDNSWRNESISSLGIVFKANNATKPFSLVLKNKTENELNAIMQKLEKDDSNNTELKERLEKLSERRKTKKKKPGLENKYNDEPIYPEISTVYAVPYDYDDTKQESAGNKGVASTESPTMMNFLNELETMFDEEKIMRTSIELMKSTTPKTIEEVVVTPVSPAKQYKPDRKPTLQYFPPRVNIVPKPKIKIYDDNGFNDRSNIYTTTPATQDVFPISLPPIKPGVDDTNKNQYTQEVPIRPSKLSSTDIKMDLHNVHVLGVGYPTTTDSRLVNPVYNMKHFRDYDDFGTKDFDKNTNKGAIGESYAIVRDTSVPFNYNNYYTNGGKPEADVNNNVYYKDDLKFDNGFHPGRFSVSYPVLFNNSVIHNANLHGRISASSSAFMKRLYNEHTANAHVNNCEPECDNLALELPPDYELHYYMPGQEEKEEVEQRVAPYPFVHVKQIQPIRLYNINGL